MSQADIIRLAFLDEGGHPLARLVPPETVAKGCGFVAAEQGPLGCGDGPRPAANETPTPGCDGRCQHAGGTNAAFGDIGRYLSYYERDGSRAEARALYAALTDEQRNWHGADLAAASAACLANIDFKEMLSRAEQKLA